MTEPTEPSPAEPTDADDAVDDDTPQTIEAARKLRAENKNLRARLKAMETDYEAAAT